MLIKEQQNFEGLKKSESVLQYFIITNLLVFSVISAAVSCTMLYNLLKFPAGVVTVSTVTAKDEEELKHYKGCYQDSFDKSLKEVTHTSVGRQIEHIYCETSFSCSFKISKQMNTTFNYTDYTQEDFRWWWVGPSILHGTKS